MEAVEIKRVPQDTHKLLSSKDYQFIVFIGNKGLCALKESFNSFRLVHGITIHGKVNSEGSYYYPTYESALLGMNDWAKQVNEFGKVQEHPRDTHWTVRRAAGGVKEFNPMASEDELCCGYEYIDGTDGRCMQCGSTGNL